MIAAISHNALLSAAFGAVAPPRTQTIDPAAGRQSDGARGEAPGTEPSVSTDTVEISALGRRFGEAEQSLSQAIGGNATRGTGQTAEAARADAGQSAGAEVKSSRVGDERSSVEPSSVTSLTPEEKQQVRELKERDQEVRRHEQAHQAAAGSLASGGASFEFENGPDGKRYAVGGEVSIDTSEVSGDPQATITKMQQVRRAALAPGSPSAQDRAVAAKAASIEQSARAELAAQGREGQGEQTADGAGFDPAVESTGIARTQPSANASGRNASADDNAEPTRNVNHPLDLFV